MNSIAIYSDALVIYWSGLVIALGVAACFALSMSLYSARVKDTVPLWVMLPLSMLLGVFFARFIHWYCHMEQYAGMSGAFTDWSVGSFFMQGAVLGVLVAALLLKLAKLTDSAAKLLDCMAPGLAVCTALTRLSSLFNSTCRSKIIVNAPALQRLPIASPLSSASGVVEYRFATFFVEFLVLLAIAVLLLRFYLKRRDIPMKAGFSPVGNTARLFLLLYSAEVLVLDSTRYDSSFFHFTLIKGLNPYAGFISLAQLVAAVSILCVLIYFSKRSVKANSLRFYHWIMWVGWLLSLAAVGVSEYLVQRHGDWYLGCYGVMSLGCLAMAFIVYRMYLSCCEDGGQYDEDEA